VILAAAGASAKDVVKVTLFLTDIDDRPRINPVRQRFFGETRPASTLIEISRLAIPGAKLEVEAVAVLG
jgi:2-iminobutanoate/2-iminopropanoate deaminase